MLSHVDDLELNTLNRFKKHSPGLMLQQHGSCEVPAGCGGVVLRWLNPAQEAYLSFTLFTPGKAELYLDGLPVHSSVFSVAVGQHLLAIRLQGSAAFLLAAQQNLDPHKKVLFSSLADGSWRASQQEPPGNWTQPDFFEVWQPLGVVQLLAKSWLREQAEELGAQALGLSGTGPLWVRKFFELTP